MKWRWSILYVWNALTSSHWANAYLNQAPMAGRYLLTKVPGRVSIIGMTTAALTLKRRESDDGGMMAILLLNHTGGKGPLPNRWVSHLITRTLPPFSYRAQLLQRWLLLLLNRLATLRVRTVFGRWWRRVCRT